ncbi:hypothetical protein C0991_008144 [Blastosporella zonata]|nr:hypothetical protein C0991_008144 [Blastosporella zonata]
MIATLGYLAIHQDEQEKAYADVKSRLGPDGQLDLLDGGEFTYLQACFHEGVRLFTSTIFLARVLPEDVLVKVERPLPHSIVLPKGSRIVLDMVNTFRNPNVYENPEEYKPARWLNVAETEVAMFGTGPRACVGRKLASTEATCVLALLLRDWTLDIVLEPGETRLQYEERLMVTGSYAGTISPIAQIPLQITRRVRA